MAPVASGGLLWLYSATMEARCTVGDVSRAWYRCVMAKDGKNYTLTLKQEKYVQNLLAGMTQRAAFRDAYPATAKWKDRSIDIKASKTLAQDNVRLRYDSLIAESAAGAVYSRQRAIADLTEIIDIGLEHVRATKGHKTNRTKLGNRELADLPRGAATILSAIEKLDKLMNLSKEGEGSGVTIVDNIERPES